MNSSILPLLERPNSKQPFGTVPPKPANMKRVLISVGTRPNFIKITQFRRVAAMRGDLEVRIVHTGQHYDRFMSSVFFEQFNLQPDFFLTLEARTPAAQVGEMVTKLAELMDAYEPHMVITPGDVNSTLAAAIACNKMGIPLAHLESGLRSFDRGMPEEINRLLTDEISDLFFVTEQSGIDNLKTEGKSMDHAYLVGNTMIDTLVAFEPQIDASDILEKCGVAAGNFALMTMHRPATVDNPGGLDFITRVVEGVTAERPLVFPIHPRTKAKFESFGKWEEFKATPGLILTEPLDYYAFQKLIRDASFILTDSGGIQEESTFRQVPCFTLRENTERPVTCTVGTNELVELDADVVLSKIASASEKTGQIPQHWDGKSTERIIEHVAAYLGLPVSKAKA